MSKYLILLLTLAITPLAFAQSANNPMQQLEKELGLTAEQKTKLEAISKQQQEKFRALQEEGNARIKEVLTVEQWGKLEALKQQIIAKQQEMLKQRQGKQ